LHPPTVALNCTTPHCSSSRVAEKLSRDLAGRIKIEDAGFDWKILGPDVGDLEYVAWQADQDAYACAGQKCSAQSMLFVHRNWAKAGLYEAMARYAARRCLGDLTAGPVLTWTTKQMLDHVHRLCAIPGARLLFGGGELAGGRHTIPSCYGALEPTAVFVPLRQLARPSYFAAATTEVFGPVQVVTEYKDGEIDRVLQACERMDNHLTAAVVSGDERFRCVHVMHAQCACVLGGAGHARGALAHSPAAAAVLPRAPPAGTTCWPTPPTASPLRARARARPAPRRTIGSGPPGTLAAPASAPARPSSSCGAATGRW